jgi:hypothetical protein
MRIASLVLGIVALLCVGGGVVTAWVPFLGSLLSFGGVILALAGIVVGGLSISRARRDGEPTGVPIAGLVTSIVAFLPGVLCALTCGLCNTALTADRFKQGDGGPSFRVSFGEDAGAPTRIVPDQSADRPDGGASGSDEGPPPAFPPPDMKGEGGEKRPDRPDGASGEPDTADGSR